MCIIGCSISIIPHAGKILLEMLGKYFAGAPAVEAIGEVPLRLLSLSYTPRQGVAPLSGHVHLLR
jgi:hypothetical protein